MQLAVNPPVLPMLAKRVSALPDGPGWIFEPKWDGFRVLVFRDGDELQLQSRDAKSLDRYFPELRAPLLGQLPKRCALDGELVIALDGGLDFEALQQRIHPADSRVQKLAEAMPASIVFWDVLCEGERDLRDEPFRERRAALERVLASAEPPLHVTPVTEDRGVASDWFQRFEGAGLDGVMAKPAEGTYQPNKRVMLKVKHERECDCVVAGFRWHKNGPGELVGSLLLGLYDEDETLHHVGVAASFTAAKRRELVKVLEPYRKNALANHPWKDWGGAETSDASAQRMPGAKSRWSQGKDLSWEPLRPELVVQVAYDHMEGTRFRHTAHFRRWRPDKDPRDCTYAQLEVVAPHELANIFCDLTMAGDFKDLFSTRPDAYARYRPTYPRAVFEWLAAHAPNRRLAIDVGTGNGQAAVGLAEHFDGVIGFDPSEAQLSSARAHPRVEYRASRAEQLAADDACADALFVAQALHWFDHRAFFAEARRVLAPSGLFAVSCYELSQITPEVDAVVMELYRDYLDAYWEPERKLVETRYRTIEFPFRELEVPVFDMRMSWTVEDLIGYLGTWSPLKRFRRERSFDPLAAILPALREAWGDAPERTVIWPLTVRAFRCA